MQELFDQLVQSIKSHAVIEKIAATGFHKLKCPICKDNLLRGGFKFEHDKIAYNCFRGKCTANTVFELGKPIPKKFRALMDSLSIEIPTKLLVNTKKRDIFKEVIDADLYEEHYYQSIDFPDNFITLDEERHKKILLNLKNRGIIDHQNFLVGTKGEWNNFLIVPFKLNGKLIGWQGIKFDSNGTIYKLSGSNLLYTQTGKIEENCIVVEGVFDAMSIPKGVACLSSTINKKQAFLLKDKNPILLPDRKGSRFLDIAKKYNWRMSIPQWEEKDVNDALIRYGKFVVARMIHEGITKNSLESELKYKMWRQ